MTAPVRVGGVEVPRVPLLGHFRARWPLSPYPMIVERAASGATGERLCPAPSLWMRGRARAFELRARSVTAGGVVLGPPLAGVEWLATLIAAWRVGATFVPAQAMGEGSRLPAAALEGPAGPAVLLEGASGWTRLSALELAPDGALALDGMTTSRAVDGQDAWPEPRMVSSTWWLAETFFAELLPAVLEPAEIVVEPFQDPGDGGRKRARAVSCSA